MKSKDEQIWRDWIETGSSGWKVGKSWTQPAPKRVQRRRRGVIFRLISALVGPAR